MGGKVIEVVQAAFYEGNYIEVGMCSQLLDLDELSLNTSYWQSLSFDIDTQIIEVVQATCPIFP